ncbi:MAG: DEAD/DEAH box helicase [Prevotella sp.]|nr:DEAD/DEAH box helicase [Prevotella sp.]
MYYIGPMSVEQSDEWQGDWLQTRVTVVLDGGRLRIPFSFLRNAILQGEQEYMLPTGERLLIPEEWMQRYGDLLLVGQSCSDHFKRHRSQVDGLNSLTTDPSGPTPGPSLVGRGADSSAGMAFGSFTLRPYQQAGLVWLWNNFISGTGCCLSDEMGLGKTIQTIALLLNYKKTAKQAQHKPQAGCLFSEEEMCGEGRIGSSQGTKDFLTSLVIAPASVVHNWMAELKRFAPSLTAMSYTGDPALRRKKRQAMMRWDVVVTTYGTLLSDITYLQQQQFGVVVMDESQTFKNHHSQIFHAVSELKALWRLALSGTPVENHLMELWSLMSILCPQLLGDEKHFQNSFVQPIARHFEQQRAELLQRIIKPYFLKRTKEQVLSDLPPRQDEVIVCPMTEEQQSLYATELSKARNEWLDGNTPENHRRMSMFAALQRLRHIANGEGKMQEVFERLETLKETGHKVLIFSEYVTMLSSVGSEMKRRGWSYDLLTGQTTRREDVISHFQQTASCQFFLISLKAGGVGLNLTAADYVFVLDPWWNLAAEEQAIARAHRIGQHRPVFVYRFVSENTLEQQILTLQERKQDIIDSVMPFVIRQGQ